MAQHSPPLAGITVIALEHAIAAPLATRQLAELGARVIKIERTDGGDFAPSLRLAGTRLVFPFRLDKQIEREPHP